MADQVRFSGVVSVDEHLLMLLPEDDPEPEASFDAMLVDLAGRSGLYVHTGCATGPVHVTVLLHGDRPADLDDTWEAQELVSIDLRGPLFVTWLWDDGTLGGPHLRPERPGPHRVRVSVRGDRSLHYDHVVDEPNEEYLVELWPDTVLRASARRPAATVSATRSPSPNRQRVADEASCTWSTVTTCRRRTGCGWSTSGR
ncbi:hypothetical protein RDV89_07580 [Nocardioides zeae]|uniref:Uncharacterized protein n=1 Tax=Nocardioides imazamoxiresistens TaxID=3231893 RepID=A0ABU3PUR1_9ACTN|nr:hypothetical protein [Nocardioides zeae]MDT9592924.1 hypothetical protein [Nocardioides zeae]